MHIFDHIRPYVGIILSICGIAMVSVGAWLVYPPAALIAAGIILLAIVELS